MSLTFTQQGNGQVPGAAKSNTFQVAGDASYPNPAGYVITPAQLGFVSRITKIVDCSPANVAAGAWVYVPIPTFTPDGFISSIALHLLVATTGVEVANGVNVAAALALFTVEGN